MAGIESQHLIQGGLLIEETNTTIPSLVFILTTHGKLKPNYIMITLSCTTNYLPLNYFGSRVIHLVMLILRSYIGTVYIVSVHPFRRNSTNKTFEQTDGQGDPYLTPKNFVCRTLII